MTFYSLLLSDVDVPSPDEKSVITYVSSIYDAFPKVPEGGEGISATVKEHSHKILSKTPAQSIFLQSKLNPTFFIHGHYS